MKIDAVTLRRSWDSWITLDAPPAGPYWLQLAWTAAFSAGIALGFTVLGFVLHAQTLADWLRLDRWAAWFSRNLVVALVIGYTIHAAFEIGGRLIGGQHQVRRFTTWQRMLFFSGIPIVAVTVALPLGLALVGATSSLAPIGSAEALRTIVASVTLTLIVVFVSFQWFAAKARAIEAERRATEAQLRLLQAQIEPHFLFNTLANVHSLVDHDTARAKAMLGAFTDYLRASLGGLRRDEATLDEELALAEAYLRVQATRLEGRLAWRIEADEAARRALLPPLMLQPLVENAVLHGLEPKVEGGSVELHARLEHGTLVVEVRDNGCGLDASRTASASRACSALPQCGAGMALANVRARLEASHGQAASLTLAAAAPGTCATLRLPAAQAAATPGH